MRSAHPAAFSGWGNNIRLQAASRCGGGETGQATKPGKSDTTVAFRRPGRGGTSRDISKAESAGTATRGYQRLENGQEWVHWALGWNWTLQVRKAAGSLHSDQPEGLRTLTLAARHARSSPTQSKSIKESINHHQPTNQPANQPTHHPSLVNPTGHRGTTCAAHAMQHSAHVPDELEDSRHQSPVSICIPSTIEPPHTSLVRHTCQLGDPSACPDPEGA